MYQKAFLPANDTPLHGKVIQRQCACGQHATGEGECAECRKKRLQRTPALGAERRDTDEAAPPVVHEVLRASGQPLDAHTRAGMENRFGADFSQVRIHAGEKAAESTQAVNARSYTVGQDVVFGAGQYAPGTVSGDRLLAHELTHTIQQGAVSSPPTSLQIGAPDSVHERAAEANEQGTPAPATQNAPGALVQREDEPQAPIESERDTDYNLRLDPDLIRFSLRVLRGEHSFGAEARLTDPVSIPLDLLGIDLGIDSSRLNAILSYDNRCNRAFQSALVDLQAGPFIGVDRVPWQVTPRVGVRIGSLRFDPGIGLGFEGSDFSSVLFTLNLARVSTEIPPECIAPPSTPTREPEKPPREPETPRRDDNPPPRRPPSTTPAALPTYTLHFFYDSTLLQPDSEGDFQRVFDLLQNVPSLHVHLTGHTSLEGTERYNQGLSDRRAEAIRDRLVLGGIDAGRIDTFGMGEFAPAVIEPSIPRRSLSPAVEEVRTLNRRVEVVFYDPTGRFQPNFPTFTLTTPGPAPSSFSLGVPKLRLGQ